MVKEGQIQPLTRLLRTLPVTVSMRRLYLTWLTVQLTL